MSGQLERGVRLNCDRLESRENPAGNVTATVLPDGYLYVRGDPAANLFSIQQNANAEMIIYGVAGTTINGLSAAYMGTGWLNGVIVVGDDGNDLAEMIGVRVYGTIYAQMGNENDSVAMYGGSATNMGLSMEGGDDVVVVDGVYVSQQTVVDGGGGFDTIDYRTLAIWTPYLALPNMERQVGGPYGY